MRFPPRPGRLRSSSHISSNVMGADFCKRNPANERVNNTQISFVPGVCRGLKERFLPFEPSLGVLLKMGLVVFFNAILELFLDALGLRHNILLDAALWHG